MKIKSMKKSSGDQLKDNKHKSSQMLTVKSGKPCCRSNMECEREVQAYQERDHQPIKWGAAQESEQPRVNLWMPSLRRT
jgi:hypothetical protein